MRVNSHSTDQLVELSIEEAMQMIENLSKAVRKATKYQVGMFSDAAVIVVADEKGGERVSPGVLNFTVSREV